ncbi:MAG: GDYXXLXY domain-containing protein, partial [Parvularculaceae bacterium]|nr:GDYXXLXY domain-containing protein [Parvularculaceae bacterium]
SAPRAPARRRSLVALLAFGALLAASAALVQNSVRALENDFREARTTFLPLAPVDPRSILQGDYMTLDFDDALFPLQTDALPNKGEVFLALDARGVARFSRVAAAGDQPKADEIRVDYRKSGAKVIYCPDSFFFQEGEAGAFAVARFAVLRVAADGKTRLFALADESLKVIDPKAEKATAGARP